MINIYKPDPRKVTVLGNSRRSVPLGVFPEFMYQCPVCARCSGLYLGYGFGILLWMFSVTLPLAVYGLFMLSMLIDWGLQAADVLPSTNVRRFVSGVLCGIAVIGIFHALLQAIF